jgi:L-amino acid N-acyltransferase YncA
MEFAIYPMSSDHWDRVREIYLEGLATGQASFETEAPAWEVWDRSHHSHSRLVAAHEDRIVAWAALSPVSGRRCYAGVAEVSIYVSHSHRGRGVGRMLLQALVEVSEKNGIWTLCASTFPGNAASLRIQQDCGFRLVGRRERIGRHHGVWRDTVLTERRSTSNGADGDASGKG